MHYSNYLIHYNKNHSKANGQFVSGDGDGDGISNDHAHRSENSSGRRGSIRDGGYSKTEGYQKGKSQLKRGIMRNVAADIIFANTRLMAMALSDVNEYVAAGVAWVGTGVSTAASVMGLVDIVKGSKKMARSAREYNSKH